MRILTAYPDLPPAIPGSCRVAQCGHTLKTDIRWRLDDDGAGLQAEDVVWNRGPRKASLEPPDGC